MPRDLNTNLRFGFLVHDVSRLRRIVIDRALKPMGITRSQWWVLAFLSRRDGMTQTALATDLDITKVGMGGLIERMAGSGYVERRADPRDGRIKRVYLTSTGIKFVSTIRVSVDRVEDEILSEISETAMQVTAETLITLKRKLLAMAGSEAESSE